MAKTKLTGVVCVNLCSYCMNVYIEETGWFMKIQLKGHIDAFKNGKLKIRLV